MIFFKKQNIFLSMLGVLAISPTFLIVSSCGAKKISIEEKYGKRILEAITKSDGKTLYFTTEPIVKTKIIIPGGDDYGKQIDVYLEKKWLEIVWKSISTIRNYGYNEGILNTEPSSAITIDNGVATASENLSHWSYNIYNGLKWLLNQEISKQKNINELITKNIKCYQLIDEKAITKMVTNSFEFSPYTKESNDWVKIITNKIKSVPIHSQKTNIVLNNALSKDYGSKLIVNNVKRILVDPGVFETCNLETKLTTKEAQEINDDKANVQGIKELIQATDINITSVKKDDIPIAIKAALKTKKGLTDSQIKKITLQEKDFEKWQSDKSKHHVIHLDIKYGESIEKNIPINVTWSKKPPKKENATGWNEIKTIPDAAAIIHYERTEDNNEYSNTLTNLNWTRILLKFFVKHLPKPEQKRVLKIIYYEFKNIKQPTKP